MKKTISISITQVPFNDGKVNLVVSVAEWSDDVSTIDNFTAIHRDIYDTINDALAEAASVNYEYEQRMDNLTGGNDNES